MKFKSIQFSVAFLAGASVLAVVVALVLYALFASGRTQNLVQQRTQALLEQVIEQRLYALAQAQASEIQRELEAPLLITADLARVNAMLGMTDDKGSPLLSISREELANLVHETTAQNPKLLGSYLGWEPNAFDASDDIYAGSQENGYDGTGRFLPWWYRNADGSLGIDAIGSMESEKLLPTGVREGEYYLCAKERKRPCVIDPAPYDVGGKMTMLASFTSPILVNGEFRGIAGADLAVNFIQDLLVKADAQLYGGLRRSGADGLAFQQNFARIHAVYAGQALDQRGFARAVFTQQGVYLAGAQGKVHLIQRLDAGELNFNPPHFQQFRQKDPSLQTGFGGRFSGGAAAPGSPAMADRSAFCLSRDARR